MAARASSIALLSCLALACAVRDEIAESRQCRLNVEKNNLCAVIPTELGQLHWKTRHTPKVLFATYADGAFVDYLETFQTQVELLGGRLLVFGNESIKDLINVEPCAGIKSQDWDSSATPCLPPAYAKSHCFQWKPRIVQQAFNEMTEDEDVLLYFDSRSMFLGDMARMVEETRSKGSLFFISEGTPPVKNVKRAVWEHLEVEPDSNPNFPYRVSASVMGFSKGARSKQIIDTWVEVSSHPELLCNGGTPEIQEHQGFSTHQHDQATITAVCVSLKSEDERCNWVVGGNSWMTFLDSLEGETSLLTSLGITCGANAKSNNVHGTVEDRLAVCRNSSGFAMADQSADPKVVEVLAKYIIGKKLRPPLRANLIVAEACS